jgi:hypothetical protein
MKLRHKGDYSKKRQEAYPTAEEQLDMLWHAMHTGGAVKVEPFYSSIKSVKDNYPKS